MNLKNLYKEREKLYKKIILNKKDILFITKRNIKNTLRLLKEVSKYGRFSYNFDDGLSMDPIVFNRMPELLQHRVKSECRNISRLYEILYECELKSYLYNAYFYLLELKRQKYKVLGISLNDARITVQEWRDYVLNHIFPYMDAIRKIENDLINNKQFFYYECDGIQYIKSDLEMEGIPLLLKDDYEITFKDFLHSNRAVSMEMSEFNLSFPFNKLIKE